jgi:uncharacterized membrane protein (UPF0127 family)
MVRVLVALGLFGCVRSAGGAGVRIVAPDGSERASVSVEVADTRTKREVGLMYRKQLDETAGMIFVFPAPAALSFWMKNTQIPLDMLFADDKGAIVGIVADAEPYTLTPRTVDAQAQYVLEVNGGFCARHHVSVGDRLEFRGFEPRGSP